MTRNNMTIEQLQGYIDKIKVALKETYTAEKEILAMLTREELQEDEAHHIVGQLLQTSTYIEQLKNNRKELIKIREDYFKGGSNGE